MNPSHVDIRQFILDTFSEAEFVDLFCSDYFPQAKNDFAEDMSFIRKAQKLIEYCQNRAIVDNLLADLRKERPEVYAQRFGQVEPRLQEITESSDASVRNPRQIFISHAHDDAEFAHRLASDLRQQGWPVWIAPDSIRPGEKWVAAIGRGLDESGVFLAVLTPAAIASTWVRSETDAAIELEHDGHLRLIPLLIQPCAVPTLLRGYQRVSFLGDYGTGLAQLLEALKPSPPPTRATPIPPEPPRGISRRTLLVGSAGVAAAGTLLVLLRNVPSVTPPAPTSSPTPTTQAQPSQVLDATPTAEPTRAPTATQANASPTGAPSPTSAPTGTSLPTPASQPQPTTAPAVAQPDQGALTIAPGQTMALVRVPAGEFLMGSSPAKDSAADANEQPQHRVYVSEFHIGRYDVTNAQFAAFVQATGYKTTAEEQGSGLVWDGSQWQDTPGANWQHPRGPGSDVIHKQDHPVTQVSWNDAVACCRWLSQATGQRVRLPTEAEWEKAARGMDGRRYPWGDAWDASRANTTEGGVADTTPVGKYSPGGDSPYGAADMVGNVWEWTADWYSDSEYQKQAGSGSPVHDPTGPTSGDWRVVRGGSWIINHDVARAAYRFGHTPVFRRNFCGFRVVAAPVP